ncbi:MAG: hypothetical protein IJV68_01720, partial [Clostridia bacterium]|nr:hypothetical protein [Clostridia bacterium]
MKKLISLVCLVALLMSTVVTFTASAEAAVYDTPVNSALWTDPNFETDVAYSFAFVGDTQYLTCGDYYESIGKYDAAANNTMQRLYQAIADTADERKLAHVFILGDITDLGYRNDYNLGGAHNTPIITGEWDIAKAAISHLDGVVPYSITRGNHDDYMIDDYFNVTEYTNQFTTSTYQYTNSAYTGTYQGGGFRSDSNAKWTDIDGVTKSREPNNPDAWVYWSAKQYAEKGDGYHKDSIVNSWKTLNIAGTDYLFITIDFNPTDNVLNWVDETLAEYPNHKAIITTHSYLNGYGEVNSSDDGSTMYLFGNPGTVLWDEVLSQHENVFMIVSGHTGGIAPTYSYNTGKNGNEVLQVLVDPQAYDAKEAYWNHDAKEEEATGVKTPNVYSIEHGTQDTGMILYMNFSKDGKRINFDYYSPLLNKFYKYTNHTIYIEADENANKGKDTNLSALEAYGQTNTYLTHKIATAPTLNGEIGANEYSFT